MVERTLVFLFGLFASFWILSSVVRSVVIPRPERVWLTVTAFRVSRWISHSVSRMLPIAMRHRVLGAFAPAVLIALPLIWSAGLILSFSCLYWAVGVGSWGASIGFSGSSITTLGFVAAPNSAAQAIAVIEALIGLGIVALMISFLPALYGTFSSREIAVGKLTTRAGAPPNPVTLLTRLASLGDLGESEKATWPEWEDWFVELGETHTSFPALIYFRSANPDHSWLTAAETALDTAALTKACRIASDSGEADLMLRSGMIALRGIADYYRIPPELPEFDEAELSIDRAQLERVVRTLVSAGVVKEPVPEDAWEVFAGWRTNYDRSIVGLRTLVGDVSNYWDEDCEMQVIRHG